MYPVSGMFRHFTGKQKKKKKVYCTFYMETTVSTGTYFPLTALNLKQLCLLLSIYLLIHCSAAKEIIALSVTADRV